MIDQKCGIGILQIFNMVVQYLPIFLTVLQYWLTPSIYIVHVYDGRK